MTTGKYVYYAKGHMLQYSDLCLWLSLEILIPSREIVWRNIHILWIAIKIAVIRWAFDLTQKQEIEQVCRSVICKSAR